MCSGDASVSNIAYTTSSFVRRMMDPHAGGDATADFNMYGVSSQQGVEDALQSVDPFAAAQTPLRGTKDRRMCMCVQGRESATRKCMCVGEIVWGIV